MAEKKLSIIIPVYNEKSSIEEIVKRVEKADTGKVSKEIIIVEINLNDNLVSLIPVLVVASVVLMVFIVTVHKEYESYTGLTFVIFGFIIASTSMKLVNVGKP